MEPLYTGGILGGGGSYAPALQAELQTAPNPQNSTSDEGNFFETLWKTSSISDAITAQRMLQDKQRAEWAAYGKEPEMPPDNLPDNNLRGRLDQEWWNQDGGEADEEKGTQPLPDTFDDPGRALSTSTANRAVTGTGMGHYVARRPESQRVVMDRAMEEEGKQVLFDQNKVPVWYESDAFSSSLISFGLNLLAGNDIATAFNQAGGVFDKSYSKEKRQAWAQDLVDQGYDAHEIQAWIETGDQKALTNPMEKKMRMQQYRLGQINLEKAMFENSEEELQRKRNREDLADDLKVLEFNANQDYRRQTLANQQAGLKIKELAANAKAAGQGDLTARDYSQLANTVMPTIKVANQRINFSDAALRDMRDIRRYKKEGNAAGVQGSMASFQYNYARAMKGGTGMITEKDKESSTKLDSKIDNIFNVISRATTGMPTDTALDMLETSIVNDIQNQTDGVRQIAEQVYNTYAPEFGHEVATRAVRRIMAGGSMGNLGFDPGTGSLVTDDRVDRIGPGTVKIQR